ncbi:MAG: hypothetical protein K2X47_12095 [Bdellovibrionales bacterium]|nr:hypothetical protein [Bdellovibrionales bacterium]
MRFFILVVALFSACPAFSFDCTGEDLPERVAKEFLKFLECGGQFREGQGECLDAKNGHFDLITPRVLAPQDESFETFQLRDSDELKLNSVTQDKKESGDGVFVYRVAFELVRGKLNMPFWFFYTMQPLHMQPSYGCAVLTGAPKNRGKRYYFSAKPKLQK